MTMVFIVRAASLYFFFGTIRIVYLVKEKRGSCNSNSPGLPAAQESNRQDRVFLGVCATVHVTV